MTERTLPENAMLIPPEAKRVFKGEIFDVYQWPQTRFDGSVATFEMLRRPDSVFIVAVDDDGMIITNDEEQPGGIVRKAHCPAGRVDPEDVSVLAAAKRELEEETGYRMKQWRLLQVTQPEQMIERFVHAFVAWGVESVVPTRHDAGEKIVVGRSNYTGVVAGAKKWIPKLELFDSADELIESVK